MKKIFLVLAAVVAFAAVSCEKDNIGSDGDKKFIKELTVNVVDESSKVTVTEGASALHFAWDNGDRIYIYLAEEGNSVYLEFTYDASTAKFVAKGEGLEEGKTYYAVRGTQQYSNTYNDDGVVGYFALWNAASLTNIPMMSDQFVATASGTIANFHHLVSIVEIPVIGTETITQPQFNTSNSTADKYLHGLFSVGFNSDGTIGDMTRIDSGDEYTYTHDEEYESKYSKLVLSATPQTLRFVVLPGDYNNIILQAVPEGGTLTECVSLGAKVIERGKAYQISSPVTLNFE